MQKFIYALLIALMPVLTAKAQDAPEFLKKDEASMDYYYEEVIQVPNMGQADIYKKAKSWVVSNFKTQDNNLAFDEKEYTIVNAAAVKIDEKKTMGYVIYEGTFDFKFHVWVKDGRYRIRIDNITYQMFYASYPDGKKTKNEAYKDLGEGKLSRYLKEQGNEKLAAVVSAFKKSMASNDANKDW